MDSKIILNRFTGIKIQESINSVLGRLTTVIIPWIMELGGSILILPSHLRLPNHLFPVGLKS